MKFLFVFLVLFSISLAQNESKSSENQVKEIGFHTWYFFHIYKIKANFACNFCKIPRKS